MLTSQTLRKAFMAVGEIDHMLTRFSQNFETCITCPGYKNYDPGEEETNLVGMGFTVVGRSWKVRCAFPGRTQCSVV